MRRTEIVNPASVPRFAVQVAGFGVYGGAVPWEGRASTLLHACIDACYRQDVYRASLPKCPDRWLSVTSGPQYLSEQATPPKRQVVHAIAHRGNLRPAVVSLIWQGGRKARSVGESQSARCAGDPARSLGKQRAIIAPLPPISGRQGLRVIGVENEPLGVPTPSEPYGDLG